MLKNWISFPYHFHFQLLSSFRFNPIPTFDSFKFNSFSIPPTHSIFNFKNQNIFSFPVFIFSLFLVHILIFLFRSITPLENLLQILNLIILFSVWYFAKTINPFVPFSCLPILWVESLLKCVVFTVSLSTLWYYLCWFQIGRPSSPPLLYFVAWSSERTR